MEMKQHWETVYQSKSTDAVSWYQLHAQRSLDIIQQLPLKHSAKIIDIGGGASTLVDDLQRLGYDNLSVLDLSNAALQAASRRLGVLAAKIKWIEGDVTQLTLPKQHFDLWHDRAVFHFLTEASDRHRYVRSVLNSVKPGGHVIIATFAEDGPEQCSDLPVQRYSAETLYNEFGSSFELLGHEKELHQTPSGTTQSFVYCFCRVTQEPGH